MAAFANLISCLPHLSGSAGVTDRGSDGSPDGISYQDLQQDMGLWKHMQDYNIIVYLNIYIWKF